MKPCPLCSEKPECLVHKEYKDLYTGKVSHAWKLECACGLESGYFFSEEELMDAWDSMK